MFNFLSTDQHYAEPSSSSGLGACAVQDSSEDEDVPEPDLPAIKKVVDVNVFEDELSPSKEKNNCLLDNSRKINKANVDLVFHRNNLAASRTPDTSEEELEDHIDNDKFEADNDKVAIAKMTVYLNHHD